MSIAKPSAPESHRLFRFEYDPNTSQYAATDVTPSSDMQDQKALARDNLQLELRLETCVHGRLSHASEDFASLLVFSLETTAQPGGSERLFEVLGVNLEFDREIPQENDYIEVLKTGEDESLGADVYLNKHGVSWSNGTPKNKLCFGVLIRRNFDDLFIGTFNLTLADKNLKHLASKDAAEPVFFDPSAAPIGASVDSKNLQAASIQILWSLGAPSRVDGVESTRGTSSLGNENQETRDTVSNLTPDPSILSSGGTSHSDKRAKFSMYHHKQRQVHKPREAMAGAAQGPSDSDLEMKPLYQEDADEQVWSDPVRYITSHEIGFKMFGWHITASGVRCIRSLKMRLVQTNDSGETEEYESAGHWSMFGMLIHKKQYHVEAKEGGQDRYIVVGRMSTNGFVIRERILRYKPGDEEHMLRKLHRFILSIRGMRGMMFSLKSVSGFGLYECDAVAGHHTRTRLSDSQRNCLQSLYNSYKWRTQGAPEFVWDDWIFKHLNNNSTKPTEGKYSLEVLLSWSVWRLSVATSVPVALSLAVGLWYQTKPAEDGGDPTGTAWIIATYIITAGALIIAFLGVATGLEQS